MTMVVIAGFLFLISIIMFYAINKVDNDQKTTVIAVASISLVLAGASFVSSMITFVPAGHRGIVTLMGKVDTRTLEEGLNFVNPLSTITHMSARVEKTVETQTAETSDTQSVNVSIITNWKPIAADLAILYQEYGIDYAQKIIPPAIQEAVKSEVAHHKVTELIARRPELHKAIKSTVNEWLKKYSLTVLEVTISDIDFSDKYDAAIEAKQVQEQEALQKKYELEKTVTEAEMAAAKAKGESDSRIAKARGEAESVTMAATAEAEALRIRAEAQADYNRQLAESLTPILIQNQYLLRWDGKLPTMMLGEATNTTLMLPISK